MEERSLYSPAFTKSIMPQHCNDTKNCCSLVATPAPGGFFGLNHVHHFFRVSVAPLFASKTVEQAIIDFSSVKFWDISALLWLIIALDYYLRRSKAQEKNLRFLFRLPQSRPGMSKEEKDGFDKSADYLRRWKFDLALRNLANDPSEMLVPEQKDYFRGGPKRFYQEHAMDIGEVLYYLISQQLVEIRNLADVQVSGERYIAPNLVNECRKKFIDSGVGFILYKQCNKPFLDANIFSKHLLNEGVLNVQEHPNASMGMVSVSLLGNAKTLVLAMADNGEPIPKTIYRHYLLWQRRNNAAEAEKLPDEYVEDSIDPSIKADIITHATRAGVSRKALKSETMPDVDVGTPKSGQDTTIGMGLTYIRNGTTDPKNFGGELTVLSAGVSVKFTRPGNNSPRDYQSLINYGYPWPGNLLRIAFPITRHKNTSAK